MEGRSNPKPGLVMTPANARAVSLWATNAPTNARKAIPTPMPTPLPTPMPTPTNTPTNGLCSNPPYPPVRWKVSRAHSTRLPTRAALVLRLCRNPPDRPDRPKRESPVQHRQAIAEQDDRSPNRLTCETGCKNEGCIELIIRSCVLASNNPRLPIAARPPRSPASESRDSFAGIDHTKTAGSAKTHQRTRQGLCGIGGHVRLSSTNRLSLASATGGHSIVRTPLRALTFAPLSAKSTVQIHGAGRSKGIYARALSRPLALLDRVRRDREARPARQRRSVDFRRNIAGGQPLFSKRGGVGGKTGDHRYINILPVFRGPLSQNSGAPVLKKFGPPVKPAALTQGSVRIRQIGLAAIWVAPGVEPTPAAISESRGMPS
jgi:hypothetical protein